MRHWEASISLNFNHTCGFGNFVFSSVEPCYLFDLNLSCYVQNTDASSSFQLAANETCNIIRNDTDYIQQHNMTTFYHITITSSTTTLVPKLKFKVSQCCHSDVKMSFTEATLTGLWNYHTLTVLSSDTRGGNDPGPQQFSETWHWSGPVASSPCQQKRQASLQPQEPSHPLTQQESLFVWKSKRNIPVSV